jgi:chemotaxis protein MotA
MKSNELVRMREYQKLDEFERRYAQSMKNRVFGKALRMRVDNLGEEDAVTALRTEIDAVRTRDQITIEVFNKMGAYAPAMGMIGTLIGLINMLESLDNPAELGPSMAIALITTFYGAALATLVFLPIAGKLTIVNSESQINLEIIFEGAIAMAKGYSNSVLYERAIGLIPYDERIEYEELVKRVRYRTS